MSPIRLRHLQAWDILGEKDRAEIPLASKALPHTRRHSGTLTANSPSWAQDTILFRLPRGCHPCQGGTEFLGRSQIFMKTEPRMENQSTG